MADTVQDRDLVALVNRLAAEAAAEGLPIDVHAIAEGAAESERRLRGTPKAIRSLSGLIVKRVAIAAEQVRGRRGARLEQDRIRAEAVAERRRDVARCWVEILRVVSELQLAPPEVALLLEHFTAHGYPELNPYIARSLRAMGSCWPQEPLAGAGTASESRHRPGAADGPPGASAGGAGQVEPATAPGGAAP